MPNIMPGGPIGNGNPIEGRDWFYQTQLAQIPDYMRCGCDNVPFFSSLHCEWVWRLCEGLDTGVSPSPDMFLQGGRTDQHGCSPLAWKRAGSTAGVRGPKRRHGLWVGERVLDGAADTKRSG